MRLFPGGTLGGDLQTVSALQGGTVEMTVLNAGILTAQVREFAVFDFPFLFATPQEADAVTDGPFGKSLLAKLEEKNLVGLGYWDLGFRNLTNNGALPRKGQARHRQAHPECGRRHRGGAQRRAGQGTQVRKGSS